MASISRVHGALSGLKKNQVKRLENLYRRRVPPERAATPQLLRGMAEIATEVRTPVSVLIDRRGRITTVALADADGTPLPPKAGETESRLRGVRLVHVHPGDGGLSGADLTALFLQRLDALVVTEAFSGDGQITLGDTHIAFVAPPTSEEEDWIVEPPMGLQALERFDLLGRVASLEEEMARAAVGRDVRRSSEERAVLVAIDTGDHREAEDRLAELAELVTSAGATVAASDLQVRHQPDRKTLVGRGKLSELVSLAYHDDADLLVFDRELSPGQAREIEAATQLKVLDRTQVILDIFAQNARGRQAQVQVELAQLKYSLPRLTGRGTALSRQGGGIGSRGPGETKLEVDRRRIRERLQSLEREVELIGLQRQRTRQNRTHGRQAVVALVGYTNAGKSTLFNLLTKSDAISRDALFATLRPTSREAWLPALGAWGGTAVMTDTVGFIRDLPEELTDAFKATLEELNDADLLLHVVDASQPGAGDRYAAVNRILDALNVTPERHVVLNKADATHARRVEDLTARFDALAVSAHTGEGVDALKAALAAWIEGDAHVPLPDDPAEAWGVVTAGKAG